jgi:GT2 family glycosyltransferase
MLHQFMEANSTVGLVMPRILYPDLREQRLCKLLPTPLDLILRRFLGKLGHRFANRRMARYLLEDVDLTNPRFVPSLSGCFMFVRREALQSVGLFDERFFLYLEDVDLCRRIAEQWETVFYPGATIIHEYANSSYRNLRHLRLHLISAWKYFNKWGWLRDPLRDALNARMHD